MEVVKYAKTALQRQALEGHMIGMLREMGGIEVINRKDDWAAILGPKLSQLTGKETYLG